MKRRILCTATAVLLSGGVALAGLGLASGTAQAEPHRPPTYHWCPARNELAKLRVVRRYPGPGSTTSASATTAAVTPVAPVQVTTVAPTTAPSQRPSDTPAPQSNVPTSEPNTSVRRRPAILELSCCGVINFDRRGDTTARNLDRTADGRRGCAQPGVGRGLPVRLHHGWAADQDRLDHRRAHPRMSRWDGRAEHHR
jgi:hypothetical protein